MNLNKLNHKNLLRTMIFVFGLVCFFSFLVSAEEPKLPLPNEFKVFKIAVIGSSIHGDDGNKKIIHHHHIKNDLNLNEFTVEKLCSCGVGEPLNRYNVASTNKNLKNKEIELYKNYPERLPINSILINREYESVVLSFYYIGNCDEAKRIIPECQYAICPFFADPEEIKGDLEKCKLKKRLTSLRDFVKHYNEMCDIRFLYYIDNIQQAENIGNYCEIIGRFCADLYDDSKLGLQQDVQSQMLSSGEEQYYKECVDDILSWRDQRAREFEALTESNKVLQINCFEVLEKIRFADELKKSISNSLDTFYDDVFLNSDFIREYSSTNIIKSMKDCYCAKIYPMVHDVLQRDIPANRLKEFYNKLCNVTVTKEIDNNGVLFKISIEGKKEEKKLGDSGFFSNDDPSFADEKSLFNMRGKDQYKKTNDFAITYKKIFSNKFVRRSICDSLKEIMLESIDVKNKCQVCLYSYHPNNDYSFYVVRNKENNSNIIINFVTILLTYIREEMGINAKNN